MSVHSSHRTIFEYRRLVSADGLQAEQRAGVLIDQQLAAAGWYVCDQAQLARAASLHLLASRNRANTVRAAPNRRYRATLRARPGARIDP